MVYLAKFIRKSPPVHLSSGLPTRAGQIPRYSQGHEPGSLKDCRSQTALYPETCLLPGGQLTFALLNNAWQVLKTLGWGTKQCLQLSLTACQQISVQHVGRTTELLGVHILAFYMKPDHCTDKRGPSMHCPMPTDSLGVNGERLHVRKRAEPALLCLSWDWHRPVDGAICFQN